MRILLTTHQFLPEYSAGTEILTFETAKELQRRGHEVYVITGFPDQSERADYTAFDRYVYDGIQVERFRYGPVSLEGRSNIVEAEYNNAVFASYFRDYLNKIKPDIVHFFHLLRLSALAIDACLEQAVPAVFTPTDFWLVCPTCQLRLPDNSFCEGPDKNGVNCLRHYVAMTQSPRLSARLDKLPDWLVALLILGIRKGLFSRLWFSRFVRMLAERPDFLKARMNKLDRVIVPARLMENILKKNGLLQDKIVFSAFGVNLTHLPADIARRKSDKLRIGFIGTLGEYKGAHILLKAVRSLPESEAFELKIYGKTDEYPDYVGELRRIIGDDRRIAFCGTFPNKQIGEIFAGLDVLVVPSIWYENTPLVIYSAQAAGCPVIASDLGGMSEVIQDNENGLLFKSGDVSGLADAIKKLVHDRGLLRRLSEKARRPKSIPEYVEELLLVYKDVLEERGHTA